MDEFREARTVERGPLRWLLMAVGLALSILALVGVFLPVLPTTPFLILAAACFARSSPELRRRLLANRWFGGYLSQWQREHTVPLEAKRKAYGLILLSIGVSVALVEEPWLRWTLPLVGLALMWLIRRLPAEAGPTRDSVRLDGERARSAASQGELDEVGRPLDAP